MNPFAVNLSQMSYPWSLFFLCGPSPWGDDQRRTSATQGACFVGVGPALSCPWVPSCAMFASGSTDEAAWLYGLSFVADLGLSGVHRRCSRSVVAQKISNLRLLDLHTCVQNVSQPGASFGLLWCCLLPVPRLALHLQLGGVVWSVTLLCLGPRQLLVFILLLAAFFLGEKKYSENLTCFHYISLSLNEMNISLFFPLCVLSMGVGGLQKSVSLNFLTYF